MEERHAAISGSLDQLHATHGHAERIIEYCKAEYIQGDEVRRRSVQGSRAIYARCALHGRWPHTA